MAKTKISEFNSNPALNTDIDSINISEGCAPSGINDAIRELMSQLKDWQAGTSNDPMVIGSSGSLTLNQGTANGVAYLNGSKVVTSGTALSFDGTNLGLGVTPSAWRTTYKALQTNGGSFYGFTSNDRLGMVQNGYVDATSTSWTYVTTAAASRYDQIGGVHAWYTAASGTAGNAITFTQAMTLDASGNLGIGTSSPAARLAVDSGSTALNANFNSTNASGVYLRFQNSGTSIGDLGSGANLFSGGTVGDFGISSRSGNLVLGTGSVERARITSSGDLLVGTTSGTGKVRIEGGSGSTPALYAYNTNNTSGDYSAVFALGSNSNNTSSIFLNCTQPGVANRFVIYGNGTYATVSDQRLKKNIETTRDGYLDDLMNLRVVKYNWNSQQDGEPKELGVIAQEVEQVFPSMVQESLADGASTSYKQVKTSILPFMLLKAIQEQQAIIESLTTRITALEGQ